MPVPQHPARTRPGIIVSGAGLARTLPFVGRGRIHPAIHADDEGILLGRVTDGGVYQFVSGARETFELDDVKPHLRFVPRPYADLAGRWADADVDDFLHSTASSSVAEALALMRHALDEVLQFPRAEHAVLLATWAIGTYFHPICVTFPRLSLRRARDGEEQGAHSPGRDDLERGAGSS
jgi:hypothetical protein